MITIKQHISEGLYFHHCEKISLKLTSFTTNMDLYLGDLELTSCFTLKIHLFFNAFLPLGKLLSRKCGYHENISSHYALHPTIVVFLHFPRLIQNT